jgi:hypothetical protein
MSRGTGFKRPAYTTQRVRDEDPEQLAPVVNRITRKASMARIQPGALTACPKRDYVRSPSLMKAYRAIPCQHCGIDDGTVCGAHANWSVFGKGGHIKADDNRAASLCARCHVPILDQGSHLTRDERKAMFWAAHVRTVERLVHLGLWPASAPIPDTENNPFSEIA